MIKAAIRKSGGVDNLDAASRILLPETAEVGSKRGVKSSAQATEPIEIDLNKNFTKIRSPKLRKALKQALKKQHGGKEIEVKGTFENGEPYVVRINSNGIGKITSQSLTPEQVAIGKNLDEILENGKLVDTGESTKPNHTGSDIFETDVRMDGDERTVTSRVEKTRDGNSQKSLFMVLIYQMVPKMSTLRASLQRVNRLEKI